jgi:hypothetical protein
MPNKQSGLVELSLLRPGKVRKKETRDFAFPNGILDGTHV